MMKTTLADQENATSVTFDLRDASGWRRPPDGMEAGTALSVGLFGDETAGPMASFFSIAPRDTPLEGFPGHGHRSDTWRVSIEGVLHVGAKRYGNGCFRFQEADILYGSDDVSWGPNGGHSLVMTADRRGAGAILSDRSLQPTFDALEERFSAWLGVDPTPPPGGAGVATSLGMPRNGRVDGRFSDSAAWSERGPGVRGVTALSGSLVCGPVILLFAAEPGASVIPNLLLETELLLVVVGGAGDMGNERLEKGVARLIAAGEAIPEIRAAESELWLAAIIGDRRGLAQSQGDAAWLAGLRREVEELQSQLRPH